MADLVAAVAVWARPYPWNVLATARDNRYLKANR
jgi:hypothetical protein